MSSLRTPKALMFMGTGSDVGKSLIVAGLARAFKKRGINVAPFKPQNMSNNAAVAVGGEIGRAQALQAIAAGLKPTVHMNPLLLKPESETGAQVILRGQRVATMPAREFFKKRNQFLPDIVESFYTLAKLHDLILVEGAGSPAEMNLRNGDLANFGFATKVNVPAILVGDIHRGGVIASIIGTAELLDSDDRKLLKGFIINKFHGDLSLFDEGLGLIVERTSLKSIGVVPYFAGAHKLPAEDAVALEATTMSGTGKTKIAVLRLPRIANFDDLDPLKLETNVSLQFVQAGETIPVDAKLVIIPGSKSTIADLQTLRQQGWDIDLRAHIRRGGHVLGLCGGFQMLGHKIHDPNGLEGPAQSVEGLGLLKVETTLLGSKTVTETSAVHVISGEKITAYEIHLGETTGPDCTKPFAKIAGRNEGAQSGTICGTYLHGCFASDGFRSAFLESLGAKATDLNYEAQVEITLDELAEHLEKYLDLPALLALAGPVS